MSRKQIVQSKKHVVQQGLSNLTADHIQEFKKFFKMFDKEKRGFINTQQIGQILRTMGQSFDHRELKQMIKEIDADEHGKIDFDKFAALCTRFVIQEENKNRLEKQLHDAFRLYDKQGNGYIKDSDLREILRHLEDNITEDELDEMISEIDTDGSGTVDFEEFMELMMSGSEY